MKDKKMLGGWFAGVGAVRSNLITIFSKQLDKFLFRGVMGTRIQRISEWLEYCF